MTAPTNPEEMVKAEGAQLDFTHDMTYGSYLHLDEILTAQHPLSPEHNEMLFIIQHQTSELWMKLILHEMTAAVQASYEAPSLYDEAIHLMQRHGITVPQAYVERDWTKPYVASADIKAAWLVAYKNPEKYWDIYQLGEKLIDIEDAFRQWRFRHVTTVERIIGFRRGFSFLVFPYRPCELAAQPQ